MTKDNIMRIVGAVDNIVEKTITKINTNKTRINGNVYTENALKAVVERAVLDCIIYELHTDGTNFINKVISCL